jgi:nitroimidazol reductase NimA-like FMN-containing flavoprotein (pyridoxamine 5'-phosphate oxidase superfamily)
MSQAEQARRVIADSRYLTVATTNGSGAPWNTPVYFGFDERFNFYWASWRENQHSRNIIVNPSVFIVIYDSNAPEGTGLGVYIQARARQLEQLNEAEHAVHCLYARNSRPPRDAREFLGDYPRRLYQATPERCWINVAGDLDGNFIDQRVEVGLQH